jgi:UPF0271 protein
MAAIDLNADLGETVDGVPTADDEAMFAVISSASIACRGHAGDAASMREAVARAARHGVAVGAHPSYPDPANFGRRAMPMDSGDLTAELIRQLKDLAAAGADVRYVKPHGALYNHIVSDPIHAGAVADAVATLSELRGRPLPVLGLGGAIRAAATARGLPFVVEAFLDRGYRVDGTLVPRDQPGALLHEPDEAAERAIALARHGFVMTTEGRRIEIQAGSLCLHGDSPGAVAMANAVRAALDAEGIEVRPPW